MVVRRSRLFAGFLTLGLMAAPTLADNTAMMSRQADHVIQINNEILKQLSGVPSNSQVSLSADVVQRNGKTELRIGTVDVGPAPGKGSTAAGAKDVPIPRARRTRARPVQFGPVLPPQATGMPAPRKRDDKPAAEPEPLPEAEAVPTPGALIRTSHRAGARALTERIGEARLARGREARRGRRRVLGRIAARACRREDKRHTKLREDCHDVSEFCHCPALPARPRGGGARHGPGGQQEADDVNAAKTDAQRGILESIVGLKVKSDSVVRDMVAERFQIDAKTSGVVKDIEFADIVYDPEKDIAKAVNESRSAA